MTKSYLFNFYTTNPVVVEYMAQIFPMFMFTLFWHMMKDVVTTILIGVGLQKQTIGFNVFSYFIIAIPISVFSTFYLNWHVYGPWTGISIGIMANTTYYYWLYIKSVKQHAYFWQAKDVDKIEYDHNR